MTGPSPRDWALVGAAVARARESSGVAGIERAWVVGSAQDALGVLLVMQRALVGQGDRAAGRARVDLSLQAPVRTPLRVSSVPPGPGAATPCRTSRWHPDQTFLERVFLCRPAEPVSLAAIRLGASTSDEDLARVAGVLAVGGHLVVLGAPDEAQRASHLSMMGLLPVHAPEGIWIKDRASAHGGCQSESAPTEEVVTLGDHVAQMELVESHRRLAYALARRFRHRGERDADLEQVALLALIRAAKRYDRSFEAGFASFATASVLGELKRHFRDKTWMMRVPRSLKDRYLLVKTAEEELSHALKTSPTIEQIARHVGASTEDVIAAMEAGRDFSPMSLDAPVGPEGGHLDVASNHDDVELAINRLDLRQSMEALDPSERRLLERVFYDRQPQRAIAVELGVSQMQVSRMVARTIKKLRQSMAPAG